MARNRKIIQIIDVFKDSAFYEDSPNIIIYEFKYKILFI